MKDFKDLTKDELIAVLIAQTEEINKVKDAIGGRKLQCLKILQAEEHTTVMAIAAKIGISARNVSSQLTYLRKDGYAIATDSLGRKFLETKVSAVKTEKPILHESTDVAKPILHESADVAKVINRKKSA